MQKHSSIIYEVSDKYFIIQRSKQDKQQAESPSENVALASILPKGIDVMTLGQEALAAINSYGTVDPTYEPWELKELRKQLCGWVGVRSYPGLMKNCRIVLLEKDFDKNNINVIPFDNNNIKPWESMIDNEIISLPIDADKESVGKAIDTAFSISTYHPERKK
jgi:hypothetical protein